ncbi:hypothetical protein MBEHAL_0723 [Halarchaeum acidiphilum MH1-52-1]|uniref:Uncharacterized protein n=1 Tax=Halarchaeum acidiphilum MH1-52-1 TaxID=1261545 RepID=U3AB22_9EURY|nr:hypothetical protein MBEHAL_0723 [Halarchaeum acidiphilum MH1-52-1]
MVRFSIPFQTPKDFFPDPDFCLVSRRAVAVLAVALLLVLAGCADGGRPTTTPTATTTSAPTNATGTATNATTSSEPVSLTHTYALPLVVRNGDDRNTPCTSPSATATRRRPTTP